VTEIDGGRVTVADIARVTGVSRATVSKVLNDRSDVAADTRAMVKATLAEHGYVKDRTRRAPRRVPPRPRLVDLVFHDAGSPWAAEMIRGLGKAAAGAQVSVVVSEVEPGPTGIRQWLDGLSARGSSGAVLAVSDVSDEDQQVAGDLDIPMVLVDPVGDFDPHLPSFGAGNWGGGLAATLHLTELGHRRIGTITGPPRYLCSQARLAGYNAALERAGIEVDPALVRPGDFHYESAVAGALELLDLPDPPTAIFAANDEQALGVYAAARMRSLRVPEDLSVVGFDDVPMSQWVLPGLTTVRQPIRDVATLAFQALMTARTDGALPAGRTELPTTLVVRGSTAPPGGTPA
jgi:LacI family transcriptional regulator